MMTNIIVTEKPELIELDLKHVEVISSKDYLTSDKYSQLKSARIFNLCRSYRYQSQGYYVSLLAEAREHKVLPGVLAIQDLKSQQIVRVLSEEVEELIQKKFKGLKSDEFSLSLYFGQNMAHTYEELSKKLFDLVKAPLMRAEFARQSSGWVLKSLKTISFSEVDERHYEFVQEAAKSYFTKRDRQRKNFKNYLYDLAILYNPDEQAPPSDEKALEQFIKAAKKLDIRAELITREDAPRLLEFDALFIRETTNVHHHTYRISRRAQAEGLVVIDDPTSILRCSNKVFLEEILSRHSISRPKSFIFGKESLEEVLPKIGLPCIIKKPDSAFSQGVYMAKSKEQFHSLCEELLLKSELLIAQEFLPSEFDWRIGVLDGKPLYACKYYMVKGHWQIINNQGDHPVDGDSETMPVEQAPTKVVEMALKSARLMGDGLYGIDIKQTQDKVYLIEVNDNPSIDHGIEDLVLKEDLYLKVMESFLRRLQGQRRSSL